MLLKVEITLPLYSGFKQPNTPSFTKHVLERTVADGFAMLI